MTQHNGITSANRSSTDDRKSQAAGLMTVALNMALPVSDRLAAIKGAEVLLRDDGDGPIQFAIEPAGDVRETYWTIVFACLTAVVGRITSARHAQGVIAVAAKGYRTILETQPAARRAEAELAPHVLQAVHMLQEVLALWAETKGRAPYGA